MFVRSLKKNLLLAAVTLAIFAPAAAHADVKIAIVDFQRIIGESKAGQSLQKQLDVRQHTLQDEVTREQQQLQAAQDNLAKQQQSGKVPDDFAQKKAEFEKKVIDTKQDIQRKHDALEKAAQISVNDLRQQAGQIVADIAQRDKIDLVIARQAILMAQKNFDITDAVLKQLDAKVTKIDLKDAPAAASAKP